MNTKLLIAGIVGASVLVAGAAFAQMHDSGQGGRGMMHGQMSHDQMQQMHGQMMQMMHGQMAQGQGMHGGGMHQGGSHNSHTAAPNVERGQGQGGDEKGRGDHAH